MKSVWDNVTATTTLEDLSGYCLHGRAILEFVRILVETVPEPDRVFPSGRTFRVNPDLREGPTPSL